MNNYNYSLEETITFLLGRYGLFKSNENYNNIYISILNRIKYEPKLEKVKSVKLPINLNCSINFVFLNDIYKFLESKKNREIVLDKYESLRIPQEPYKKRNKYCDWELTDRFKDSWKKSFNHKYFDIELNKLKYFYNIFDRFKLEKLSKYRWLKTILQNENNVGNEYEVAVAHHCEHNNIKCRFCNKPNLRLAGGSSYPWIDIICDECGTPYEVKLRKKEIINKILYDDYKIFAGSYRHFNKIKKNMNEEKKGKKHYIILVSYEGDVYISIIKDIELKLCKETIFCSKPRLNSIVIPKKFDYWFNLDVKDMENISKNSKSFKKEYIEQILNNYAYRIQRLWKYFKKKNN